MQVGSQRKRNASATVPRVMAEALKTVEDAASQIKTQTKEEQRQLREANTALTEAKNAEEGESTRNVRDW